MSFWDRQAASLYFPGVYAQGAKPFEAAAEPPAPITVSQAVGAP